MEFDPTSITQDQLHELRNAAEHAWGDDTRHPDYHGHPQPSAGQCYVTSRWLQDKLGGYVGMKQGHYFWVSPDKTHVVDLTGDQYAYAPVTAANLPQDADDEPYNFEPEHYQYRPGPVVYTRADHPLYKGFRVKEYPNPNPRATAFAQRATAALERGLHKHADGGTGGAGGAMGDAYPGQTPQMEEDMDQKYFHDSLSDLQLTMEKPPEHEYRFFYGNGQLHVSPIHDHDELRDHSGTPANHDGPMAVGYVNVRGKDALWSVETNIGLRGLVKELQDYSKRVGWDWGGLVGGDGQPVHDDFAAKKSYWYRDDNGLKISDHPLREGRLIRVDGRTAHVAHTPPHLREGLQEWAQDFGYRLAEYPGGTDMTDRIKNKEHIDQFNLGDPEAKPEEAFDGVPQGELTCPRCGQVQRDYQAYVLHTKEHLPKDMTPIDDGHFPTLNDKDDVLPIRLRNSEPTAMPLASFREASLVPDFDLYANLWGFAKSDYHFYGGYLGGQLVGYGVVDPKDSTVIMLHSAVPRRGVGTAILAKILQHHPNARTGAASTGGESLIEKAGFIEVEAGLWKHVGQGSEGKDLLQAPLPFVYDIDKDYITVGHPGMKTSDIMGQFTPGGIVEGYYEPGGKIVINTTTTMPYSTFHLMQLWYYSHPHMEITSLELEKSDGDTHKLASADVGSYIKTLTAADGPAWNAFQALRQAGGKVYVVGGAVRDALLQKEPKDIDLMVAGLPTEQVHNVLDHLPGRVDLTGKRFGVYRYHTKGGEVEIALPRVDSYDEGERRGQGQITVDHNLPVEKDLARRDFTANSMAVDLETGQLVDPYGGADDIAAHTLRTTHPNSFDEDPTRLVRALTASSRHGLVPDERTRKEMEEHAYRLDQESPDALKQQLDKLLTSPNPAGALRLAQETGVLKHLFPELANNFDYDQKNPHHNYTLGEHSLNVLQAVADKTTDPDLRLAALLHDVGKPSSAWDDPETGIRHYYPGLINGQPVGADHAAVGADLTEQRLRETYNYPVAKLRRIHNLINQHMFPAFSSPKGARKFLSRTGDAADDLLTLRECDNESKGTDTSYKTPVETMRGLVEEARQVGAPTNQSMISVNGNDLIQLGLKPGPQVGTILRQLTNDVVAEPELNDKAALMQRAQEYIQAQPEG